MECLWPHAFFAVLYHRYREHFFTYVIPSFDRLRAFWKSQRGDGYIFSSSAETVLGSMPLHRVSGILRFVSSGTTLFKSVEELLQGRDLDKIVPLSLHGDGTPCAGVGKSWGKMGDFWSWASLLAYSGHAELCRYLVAMLHAHTRTAKTLDKFFTMLRWSLFWLLAGRWFA